MEEKIAIANDNEQATPLNTTAELTFGTILNRINDNASDTKVVCHILSELENTMIGNANASVGIKDESSEDDPAPPLLTKIFTSLLEQGMDLKMIEQKCLRLQTDLASLPKDDEDQEKRKTDPESSSPSIMTVMYIANTNTERLEKIHDLLADLERRLIGPSLKDEDSPFVEQNETDENFDPFLNKLDVATIMHMRCISMIQAKLDRIGMKVNG